MDDAAQANEAQATLLAQLQAEVQALRAAATAAAAAAAAAPPPAAGPPVFTLAPALASSATFVDLTSSNGAKHFKGATEPLNKLPFNFKDPSDLQVFLDLVLKKSQVWGWNPIFTIPVLNGSAAIGVTTTNHSLLDEYGLVPMESVRAHVMAYYATPTKRAQDSFMSCQCLLSSLTLDFLKLITADSSKYHVPALNAADGPVPSGPLLLKLIISKAHVDSRATVSFIRDSLTKLDAKMIELDSDVAAFNSYVQTQVKNLSARGESSNDLLVNLFKGYKAANDVEFYDFIKRKQSDYEEGKDVDALNLMATALVKYEARNLTKEWSAPTKEQGQILALTAQLEKLKTAKKPVKPAAAPKAEHTPRTPRNEGKWAWKSVLPKEGEPTTKTFEGKQYHVNCEYHAKQWVCHSSAECNSNPANKDKTPASNSRRLKAAKIAAAALAEDEDEDSDEGVGY
jgi:hypothetical protein